jgi:hypothetical protein
LASLQKHADAKIVHAGVVADDDQVLGALAPHRLDKVFRNTAETKAADEDGHAITKIGEGVVGGSEALVHGKFLGEVYRS